MAYRKRVVKTKYSARPVKRRKPAAGKKRKGNLFAGVRSFVPVILISCIVFGLGFLLFMGYRTVTASAFFDVKSIDVRGANRVPREEIEKIVQSKTVKATVWNADLDGIKAEVEKLPYVKSVVVSRVLPDGVRVRIDERNPKAVARMSGGDVWVDETAQVLGKADKTDQASIVLRGLDENKTDKAQKDNQERVKLFTKIQTEFQNEGLASRVKSISVLDLLDPEIVVEDSGKNVSVFVGREEFAKRLQKALEAIEGKGEKIESLISHGGNVLAKYRNN
jgi:cell division septal protein FtsQ